jgi:hypothetical protein
MEYYKGAWVVRMLRDLLGKAAFDAAIVEYLTTHAYGAPTTDDLQTILEAHYGGPLDWFFQPWLYGTGHPKLRYAPIYAEINGTWHAMIVARQTQPGVLFRYPLEVRIATTAGDVLATGWIEGAYQVLDFPLAAQPTGVTLDPANKILDENLLDATTGIDGVVPARLAAWPNPFERAVAVAGARPAARIEIFDALGRRVRALAASSTGGLAWDGTDGAGRRLTPGPYFIRQEGGDRALRVILLPGTR